MIHTCTTYGDLSCTYVYMYRYCTCTHFWSIFWSVWRFPHHDQGPRAGTSYTTITWSWRWTNGESGIHFVGAELRTDASIAYSKLKVGCRFPILHDKTSSCHSGAGVCGPWSSGQLVRSKPLEIKVDTRQHLHIQSRCYEGPRFSSMDPRSGRDVFVYYKNVDISHPWKGSRILLADDMIFHCEHRITWLYKL